MSKRGPPIGGANLECLLLCRELDQRQIKPCVDLLNDQGFVLRNDDYCLLAYVDDSVEPILIRNSAGFEESLKFTSVNDLSAVIVNLEGMLFDTRTNLSVIFDFEVRGVEISALEDVIWRLGADTDRADFRILRHFGLICKQLAACIHAGFGSVSTEIGGIDLFREDVEKNPDEFRLTEKTFSDEALTELYDWYLSFYTKRWNK